MVVVMMKISEQDTRKQKILLPELIHGEQAVSTGASLQGMSLSPCGFPLEQQKKPPNSPH